MQHEKNYIAVDLGAESGRVMLGGVSAKRIELKEIHRFPNGPIKEADSLRWNFPRLLSEIKAGIGKAIKQSDSEIGGIGVDSWGVDFGLIASDGRLLENPYNYRDSRTNGMMEKAFRLMDKSEIYKNTGLQFMQINTIYQLFAQSLQHPEVLAKAEKLLFTADLVSYFLCGRAYAEYSLASTSQLMDMRSGQWSKAIFDKLSLPLKIMPEVVRPATVVGSLNKQICRELGCSPIDVIAVASHDTASAVAAVPAKTQNWAYLSSGTWSLMGIEAKQAIINDKGLEYSFTNEGGVENTIRFLKNLTGLWILQQCRSQWQKDGADLSYSQLTAMAQKAKPFAAFIDTDYADFAAPGNMPAKINDFLARTRQDKIEDKGQLVRVILESLAFKYRLVMEAIEDIAKEKIQVLHIVGGGIQNELLCQFTADAIGKKVITGPTEATAAGNILLQAKAKGQIKTLHELREIAGNTFDLKEYQPKEKDLWNKQYKTYQSLINNK